MIGVISNNSAHGWSDPYRIENEGLQPPYWSDIEPPDILPLECGIERETPLSDYLGSKDMPNGLTVYLYDTNEDGKRDVSIAVPTGDENRHPLFYFFDRDFDGEPDIGYHDTVRDGHCYFGEKGNILVYWTPKMDREREKAERKYRESDCVSGDCDKRQEGEL